MRYSLALAAQGVHGDNDEHPLHGRPGGEPAAEALLVDTGALVAGRVTPPDLSSELATSWFEFIDDVGATIWAGELRCPALERRCARVGVRLVLDPASADTVLVSAAELELVEGLPATVTIVCLAANRLRVRPWPRGAHHRVTPTLLPRVVSATGVDDIRRGEVFGLLRSVAEPRVALSLRSPVARQLVLQALALHIRGIRLSLLRLLVGLGRFGWFAYPGWLVVAHGDGRAREPRVAGQFGYEPSTDVTRFLGEPPELIERAGPADPRAREAAALRELEATDFKRFVPRVVASADPQRGLITTRLRGVPLSPRDLSDDQLMVWTECAAATLARLQAATEHEDGTVLVHGDFWLGNVSVEDGDVVGVFDWELAHRGSRQEDREFLVDGLVGYLDRDAAFAERVRSAVARGLERASV